jgi:hypothetical protein
MVAIAREETLMAAKLTKTSTPGIDVRHAR